MTGTNAPLRRVLVFVATVHMGGAEIQALRNCEVLLRSGHQVTLVTVFRTERDFYADYLRQLLETYPGFAHTALLTYPPPPVPNLKTGLHKLTAGLYRLRRMITAGGFEVLYTRSWPCSLLAWLAQLGLARKPRLIFNEENSLRHNPSRLKGRLRMFLLNRAQDWLVPCHGLYQEALAMKADAERGDVLPNIVPMPELSAGGQAPGSTLRIGFLGRLEPQKGLERLVEVLARLERKGVDFEFKLAGAGSLDRWFRAEIERHELRPRVRYLGPVRDLAAYFGAIDVLVLTSHHEGFANVLIEANAYGVPVVAMNVPHGPADIVADGINGFLVPDGDVVAMAERLGRTPIEVFRSMGPACREVAARHYSLEAQAARWARLLAVS